MDRKAPPTSPVTSQVACAAPPSRWTIRNVSDGSPAATIPAQPPGTTSARTASAAIPPTRYRIIWTTSTQTTALSPPYHV
jgi:hypothetical protein